MKIAIDGRLIFKRGVGRYTANLLKELAMLDKKNSYTIFLNRKLEGPDGVAGLRAKNFEYKVLRAPNPAWWEQITLPCALDKEHFDLVHFPDSTASFNLSIPFVVTIHDTLFLRPLRDALDRPTLYQRFADRYRKWVIPRIIPKAARVITVSDYSAHQLGSCFGIGSEKLSVTQEAADPAFFRKAIAAEIARVREKYRIPGKYFLNYGALDLRKNSFFMLKAFSLLAGGDRTQVQLVMLGMPEAEVRQGGFFKKAAALGIADKVRFLPAVPQEDLAVLYQSATAFVFPSRGEGFGLSVLEAFASDTPVIASDATSIPEVAGGAALLLPPFYAGQWSKAMQRLLVTPTLRVEMIKKGRERVKKFSWRKTAAGTLSVYREVLRKKGKSLV